MDLDKITELDLFKMLFFMYLVIPIFWFLTDHRNLKERFKSGFSQWNIELNLSLLIQFLMAVMFDARLGNLAQLTALVGFVIFGCGLGLCLWSRLEMGKYWGLPATLEERQDQLVKTGPFQFTRNPIYLGFILVFFGFFLALRSPLLVLVLKDVFDFYDAILGEESLLEAKFGEEYLQYKRKVPRLW